MELEELKGGELGSNKIDTKKETPSERGRRGGRPHGTGRDSNKLITLRDTDDKSGYLEFKSILKYFPKEKSDQIYDRPIEHSKIHDMQDFVEEMSRGQINVSPMICRGDLCEYRERCIFLKEGIAPIDSSCPMEESAISSWARWWSDTLEVDTSNMVEVNQVSTMIICDLMLMRLRNRLATSSTGNIVYTPVGVDKFGNVILRMEPAPEIAMEEKYNKMKERTLEALLATRESRAKHGIMNDKDLAKKGPAAIVRAQHLMKQLEGATRTLTKEVFADMPVIEVVGGEE